MKWDKENKDKLHQLFSEKLNKWELEVGCTSWEKWSGFFNQFGIVDVSRRDASSSYSENWMQQGSCIDKYDTPAVSRKHIIILDPWWGGCRCSGLKIPKDLADKFLILGVP